MKRMYGLLGALILAWSAMSLPVWARQALEVIALPDGFAPEGIEAGPRHSLLVGSIVDGSIYRADPKTGTGSILIPSQTGRSAVGIKWDKRTDYLYVSGGSTGQIFVYDLTDGSDVAVLSATLEPSLVNDAVITHDAVYFTESYRPVIYRLPLGPGGILAHDAEVEEIPLSGDFQFEAGQINANGIEAGFDGKWLLIVNSYFGELYRVDPLTGESQLVDLGGASLAYGDGILLEGCKLFVVQNFLYQVSVVALAHDKLSGEIVDTIFSPNFDVPTTIARLGGSYYTVNARFDVPPTPETSYDIVRVPYGH